MKLNVAFRVDASLQIGTGHVMRCLTLAKALLARGADCQFICRAHEGNLIEFIRNQGFVTHAIPVAQEVSKAVRVLGSERSTSYLAHAHWLGASQSQDAEACAPILAARHTDWLIVDHYGLDAFWERALASHYRKLAVIDDLADRLHACDLLLDQTFGREAADYDPFVPAGSLLLCGSQYALLRPEFAALRHDSLQRRSQPVLRELLITLGGVDKDNVTGKILQALRCSPLPADCRVTVVVGMTSPWLDEVRAQAQDMPWQTRVLIGVSDMATLMTNSDLAIGAAGATSWERCCLGLPTAMVVLAENQIFAAQILENAKAVRVIKLNHNFHKYLAEFIHEASTSETCLASLRDCASLVTDGNGCKQVATWLTRIGKC